MQCATARDARYAAAMEPKAILRQLSPSAYRSAVRLRRGSLARAAGAPARAKAKRQFAAGAPLTVDVATSMGLGAILLHAAQGLYAGQAFGVDVALSFTSPTYAPSSCQGDWLEHYFVRLGS